MKMSLGRKLGFGFGVVLALMVCSAGLTYWKISDMRSRQEAMINIRIPSLIYSRTLNGQISNSASRTREYILMADDSEVAARVQRRWPRRQKTRLIPIFRSFRK